MRHIVLLVVLALSSMALDPCGLSQGGPIEESKVPDLTQGAKIPEDAKHDWNLGATGLRGWMHCDKMVTSDARQIAVTKVAKGSPADGIFEVGDVILGVGDSLFDHDPRSEMGKALTIAERSAQAYTLASVQDRASPTEVAHSRNL
jgi:hypothetical protein